MCTGVPLPGEVAPVPKVPAERQTERPMKWRHAILILAALAAVTWQAIHSRQ